MSSPTRRPQSPEHEPSQLSVDPYDSAPIETAEEVEVPSGPGVLGSPQAIKEPPTRAAATLDPPPLQSYDQRAAALRSQQPSSAQTSPPASLPAPPAASLLPGPPAPSSIPWSSRLAASLPPAAIQVARRHPVLWLVAAPVFFAGALIFLVAASQPQAAHSRSVVAVPSAAAAARPQASASAVNAPATRAAALADADPSALGVHELLLLNDDRSARKRMDAEALAHRLSAQPELVGAPAIQAELLRFAADPGTAAPALGAMARASAPVGADLLYEVWTSRSAAPGTAELARSLLYSREVRPTASAALDAALELRSAAGCVAVRSALARTQKSGDNRAFPALIQLSSGRSCGPREDDCQACLRSNTKLVVAAVNAAKSRPAPSYPPLQPR